MVSVLLLIRCLLLCVHPLPKEAPIRASCLSVVYQFTGDEVPPQPKPQDPPLLDGASSRFADAFIRRTTQARENGNRGVRPWAWAAGATALTACILLIVFAVTKFPSGSDDKGKAAASSAVSPGTHSSPQPGGPHGSPSASARPHGAHGAKDGAGSPANGGGQQAGDSGAKSNGNNEATATQSTPASGTNAASGSDSAARRVQTTGSTPSTRVATYPGVAVFSHASGRCVAATGAANVKATSGTRLEIWDCVGGSWEKIDFRSDGTARMFGLCMSIAGASQNDGAAIQLATCNGSWAQRFNLNDAHDLVNTTIGKCVDVVDNGTANGTKLQLWTCFGTDNQKWSKR
ncbi:RICIN domain-containing protein [Streptomyces adustus]|uniref:RICIN domain-containing protein n=1 Tax=Streptomyces adustus TaxID=1609272 RepID=A0A5N8V649_9ACTN|nr:RICIN domain-containing protein [Streptomyces adustus]